MFNLGVAQLFAFAAIVTTAAGIIDAVGRPPQVWKRAHRSKAGWILLQLILAPLGSIAYWAFVRRELKRNLETRRLEAPSRLP